MNDCSIKPTAGHQDACRTVRIGNVECMDIMYLDRINDIPGFAGEAHGPGEEILRTRGYLVDGGSCTNGTPGDEAYCSISSSNNGNINFIKNRVQPLLGWFQPCPEKDDIMTRRFQCLLEFRSSVP